MFVAMGGYMADIGALLHPDDSETVTLGYRVPGNRVKSHSRIQTTHLILISIGALTAKARGGPSRDSNKILKTAAQRGATA